MRLLLDTSIVVPIARLESESLTKTDRAAISDPDNTLFVSVVALWEIAIKTRLGKLEMRILPRDLPAHLTGMGMQLLAIDVQHVLADLQNDVETRDPFDRLLIAQCEVENLRLVTTDPALLKHPLAWRG
ncbi:MAG TPA: type II toxin-antitoxin system VapC family toxin [Rhizomicrobium sp.]|jgi:PIN domain nuclease of toxin-antitoxin system